LTDYTLVVLVVFAPQSLKGSIVMTAKVQALDDWIRSDFRAMNTALEHEYSRTSERESTIGIGDNIKSELVAEGTSLIADLLLEGNTDQGFDSGFELLGNVGFYMAACRRHEITEPSREKRSPLHEASALAMQLGASLGVIPRFASCHLETHNRAINGLYKTFTDLEDERTFIDFNTRGVFAFIRASEALRQILPLGISHPLAWDLLQTTKTALQEVYESNQQLFDRLDIDQFFYSVRPYYRPHRVGLHEYRGANAGDFAGINVIDLLLGLCRPEDPYYSQLLVDKFLFMRPEDQLVLRDTMRCKSLMDSFLEASKDVTRGPWFERHLALFLEVCEAHGKTALQHHEQLVAKFIERPAAAAALTDSHGLTASGPPLPALLKGLRKLCDMRCAANVGGDFNTRHEDIKMLRACL